MPEQPNGRTVEVMPSSGAMAVPERRDPSAATQPVQWVTPGIAQPAAWDATRAFKQGYSASVWVNRCVSVIATTVASLPFRAGLDPNDRGKVAENARLSQLLGPPPNGPAPGFSARRWWTWLITQYIVTGRFSAEIEEAPAGGIAALWPMPSAIVSPIPTKGGAALFSGFKIGSPNSGNEKTMTPDRVLYHWRPSGTDIREAESVLQAAQLPVSVDVMLGQYTWSFLKNDARPAAVIVTPQFATDDDFDEFANQFIDRHAGPWNAGKVAFVEASDDGTPVSGAIDVKNMGLSQKDAQMLETHKAAAEAICVALGVPMSILDASGRTYSNAGEEKVTFWQNTILPLLADLEDAVNSQIAPRVGREVGWFDTTSVAELQPASKLDPSQASQLVEARLITPNEARSELGLPPLIGGYSLLPALEAPPVADPEASRATTVVNVHGGPDLGAPGTVDTRARQWKRVDQQARVLEQSWVGTLQALFEKQRRTALATLTGKKHASRIEAALRDGSPLDVSQVAGVFDQARWRSETSTVGEDLYRRALALGLDRIAASDIGISFDLASPWAKQLILDRSNMLAGHITSTTYAQVQQALTDGVAAGEGIDDIARRIEAVFDQAVGQRAEVIARTEVISASNGAVHEVAQAAPDDVVGGKEWIAAEDERTRDSHADADGQIVEPSGTFDIGGSALRFPGDPAGDPAETINCRCVLALVTPKEMPK